MNPEDKTKRMPALRTSHEITLFKKCLNNYVSHSEPLKFSGSPDPINMGTKECTRCNVQELKSVNFGDGASFQNIEHSSISSAQPAFLN